MHCAIFWYHIPPCHLIQSQQCNCYQWEARSTTCILWCRLGLTGSSTQVNISLRIQTMWRPNQLAQQRTTNCLALIYRSRVHSIVRHNQVSTLRWQIPRGAADGHDCPNQHIDWQSKCHQDCDCTLLLLPCQDEAPWCTSSSCPRPGAEQRDSAHLLPNGANASWPANQATTTPCIRETQDARAHRSQERTNEGACWKLISALPHSMNPVILTSNNYINPCLFNKLHILTSHIS